MPGPFGHISMPHDKLFGVRSPLFTEMYDESVSRCRSASRSTRGRPVAHRRANAALYTCRLGEAAHRHSHGHGRHLGTLAATRVVGAERGALVIRDDPRQ